MVFLLQMRHLRLEVIRLTVVGSTPQSALFGDGWILWLIARTFLTLGARQKCQNRQIRLYKMYFAYAIMLTSISASSIYTCVLSDFSDTEKAREQEMVGFNLRV